MKYTWEERCTQCASRDADHNVTHNICTHLVRVAENVKYFQGKWSNERMYLCEIQSKYPLVKFPNFTQEGRGT